MKNRLIFGFGVNDCQDAQRTTPTGKTEYKKFLVTWKALVRRCYSKTFCDNRPNTKGYYLCEEWRHLSNYKKWYDENYVEGYQLAAYLVDSDEKERGPNNCVFLPEHLIKFMVKPVNLDGSLVGVQRYKAPNGNKNKQYKSHCNNPITGIQEFCGYHFTQEEAHSAWKVKKCEFANLLADNYTGIIDDKVITLLREMYL